MLVKGLQYVALLCWVISLLWGFPSGAMVKNPFVNAGDADVGSIPGSEIFPGVENGNPLQYSCLENFMDRGVWWAIVHKATKRCTRLSNWAHRDTHLLYIIYWDFLL